MNTNLYLNKFSKNKFFKVLTHLGNLRTLNIIALVMPCIVLAFCIALPRVHWKVMVGRMLEAKGKNNSNN